MPSPSAPDPPLPLEVPPPPPDEPGPPFPSWRTLRNTNRFRKPRPDQPPPPELGPAPMGQPEHSWLLWSWTHVLNGCTFFTFELQVMRVLADESWLCEDLSTIDRQSSGEHEGTPGNEDDGATTGGITMPLLGRWRPLAPTST
ncbi:uncharacterized protein F5147DRAFT_759499 [Suillus discolor]|uniref:Uncharacterized protein n=1 Tax=Suillus discolor TaxID=1912936 RepID=A0A9P7JW25_9AGAM|nr:uncharacterized protein F5147DRAFT_759499 [Suillus discolor]KAG2112559.1 hypothetical protein F5147DRAFT_759499 [Suillus discolor]